MDYTHHVYSEWGRGDLAPTLCSRHSRDPSGSSELPLRKLRDTGSGSSSRGRWLLQFIQEPPRCSEVGRLEPLRESIIDGRKRTVRLGMTVFASTAILALGLAYGGPHESLTTTFGSSGKIAT